MNRTIKNTLKRILFASHKLFLKFGFHFLPVHYYSALADIRELKRNEGLWAKPMSMEGITIDLASQSEFCRKISIPVQKEFAGNPFYKEGVEKHYGPGYGYIEAQALHSLIRFYKPARIVEVGSGVSTFCSVKACKLNSEETGSKASIICIEPYPSAALLKMQEVEVMKMKVQECDYSIFEKLSANDLLFIDSSHTVKTGSDVNFLILEVLPRLKPGVIVHFHDIYFPYNYQRDILHNFLQWNETALLHAFLINNRQFEILASLSMLHYSAKEALKESFPEYNSQSDYKGMYQYKSSFEQIEQHYPSSLYLLVK